MQTEMMQDALSGEPYKVQKFLGNAIHHLADHWPERTGWKATKSFWAADSYPDYAACQVLQACIDLVNYCG